MVADSVGSAFHLVYPSWEVGMWNVFVTKLQSVLAQLFPGREDCVVLCHEAGVSTDRIDFDEPSYVRWYHILDETMKQEALDNLLVVVSSKYPQNRALNQATADWVNNRQGGSELSVPASEVFQASVVRDLATIDRRLERVEAALMALAAGREAEIAAGTVSAGKDDV